MAMERRARERGGLERLADLKDTQVGTTVREAILRAGDAAGADRGSTASAAQGRRRLILLVTGLLYVFGLVMVASATSGTNLLKGWDWWHYVNRQLLFGGLGVLMLVAGLRINPGVLRRCAPIMLLLATIALFACFVPGVAMSVNGASRWVNLGLFSFQPSELVKFGVLLLVASYLAANGPPREWGDIARSPVGWGVGLAMVVYVQRDLGTAMITAASVLVLYMLAGAPWRRLLTIAFTGTGLVMLGILSVGYRRERFLAFLDPFADPQGDGFQLVQAQVAIGSGGPLGVGLGGSVQKIHYVPEAHTDMIYSIIAEELGLVGVLVILVAFAALAVVGIRTAAAARNRFEALLAAGLTAVIVGQAILNVAGVVGALPLTGVTLPLVSYGGSSLLITFAALGLLANLAGRGHDEHSEVPAARAPG